MKKRVVHVLLVLIVCSLALVFPAASVENRNIAFNSDRNDNYEIHVMYPDGFGQNQTYEQFNGGAISKCGK